MSKKIAVIGGGLAGLSAAVRLAGAGLRVTLFEKNDHFGGKMNVLKQDGFTFDMGPTIITMPQVLRRLFSSVGRDMDKELPMARVDPQWRAIFEDGASLDLWTGREDMKRELAKISPEDAAAYDAFRSYVERMYDISEKFFFWKDVGGLGDLAWDGGFLDVEGLKILKDMNFFRTVGGSVDKHFQHPHWRQVLEHFMQYVGSSPLKTPAILCAIHHIQLEFGVWYPMGGTNRVAAALERVARELGADLRPGARVDGVEIAGGAATGVRVGGRVEPFDAVVSNMDFVRSHTELLPEDARERVDHVEPACSGIVFYWGLDKKYDMLSHHNFFFSKDPHREFADIYDEREPTQDPTLCVCAPSRTDPSVAPEGCENFYVLVHVPPVERRHDWDAIAAPYRELVLAKLERCGMPDIRRHIKTEGRLLPTDIRDRYLTDRGAIYGMASHGRLSGGFKPSNRSRKTKGLYFTGGSVNPGPGVPMVVMSGQIAAESVLTDFGIAPAGGTGPSV